MPAGIYQGNLFTLLNPYGLLGGVLFVCLFLVHGSLWLAVKTEGDLQARAGAMAARLWPVLLVVAAMFLLGTRTQTPLFDNYLARPVLLLLPTLAVAALICHLRVDPQGRLVEGLVRLLPDHCVHHPLRRGGTLSQPVSVEARPCRQPHRVQLVFQPHDFEDHAGSGAHLRTPGDCLPGLGAHPL